MKFIDEFRKKKNFLINKENIYFFLSIISIFTLDRISKINIINHFNDGTHFLNDFVNFDLIWNTGIGFGLLSSESSFIYSLITFIISSLILFLFYLAIISDKSDKIIYSIIIGGALGNIYDRLVYNAVPDFINLHYENFHWFIFNVADIFITLGIIFFVMKGFFEKN